MIENKIKGKAFLKFDKEDTFLIDIAEIRQVYNCSKHPKVVSAEISEQQILRSLLKILMIKII